MSTNETLGPGSILGRYELLLPIAQGGMATVWAARQKGSHGFQKTVAIKTILPNLSDDPQFEQMFIDEASLASRIHHPNVAEILDQGQQGDTIYLVMEWIDGEALSVIHKQVRNNNAQLPLRIAVRVAIQACAGLHAAHELRDDNEVPLQLVHRDVSPQNILVTYDGVAKLVDFGVAKAMNRAGGETTAGQLKGKVPYMSPEQARGGRIDRRTDIFAMGIVLYKLTTGLHPFLGENDLVTMKNILQRPLLPPRVKAPSYPEALENVIVKCLQKDADKRYETMFELGSALERALAAMGVADDDVGGFLRGVMGERGAKRRAAIRDATRAQDERVISGARPSVAPSAPVHEGVSEILLTQMATGVKDELLSDRPSMISESSTGALAASPSSRNSSDVPMSVPGVRRGRQGVFIAAGIGVAALFIGGVALSRSGSPRESSHVLSPSGQAALPPNPAVTPPPAPLPPIVTEPAAPSASTTGINISDFPDDKNKDAGPNTLRVPGPMPTAAPSATPSASASVTPAPTVSPRVDKRKHEGPTFTDPGF